MEIQEIVVSAVYEKLTETQDGRIISVSDWGDKKIASVSVIIEPVEMMWFRCIIPRCRIVQSTQFDLPLTQTLIDILTEHRLILGVEIWQIALLNNCLTRLSEPSACECN